MKLTKIPVVFLSLLMVLHACSPAGDQVAVENVLAQLLKNDNEGNLGGVMSHYSDNAILMSPDGPSINGSPAIRDHYQFLFDNFQFKDLIAVTDEIVVRGDFALIAGVNSGIIQSKTDFTSKEINSKFVMLFKKTNSSWKITRLIWNNAGAAENVSQLNN